VNPVKDDEYDDIEHGNGEYVHLHEDLLKSDENDEEGGDGLSSSKMKKTFKASFKLDSSDGVFKFDKLQIEQVRRRESGHRHLDGHWHV